MKQRNNSDCGIVCVARLAEKSYREVRSRFGIVRGGMELHEFEWILGEFCSWTRKRTKKISVSEFAERNINGKFAVVCTGFIDFHVVAVIGGKVAGWDCGHFSVCRVYEITPVPLVADRVF